MSLVVPLLVMQIWAGAAMQADFQRFPDDVVPNRLNGSVAGWTVLGGAEPVPHLAVAAEWTADTIRDRQTLGVDISGRKVTIQSTLSHRTRIAAALAGFTHTVGSRFRLSYLAGAGWMRVERTFITDAVGFVLQSPSDSLAPATSTTIDRSVVPVGGCDTLVRITRHVSAFGGARIHAVALGPEERSGRSVRILVGGAWVF